MKVALGAGSSRQPRKNWGTSNPISRLQRQTGMWYNLCNGKGSDRHLHVRETAPGGLHLRRQDALSKKRITLIGISFSSEKRTIVEELVEEFKPAT